MQIPFILVAGPGLFLTLPRTAMTEKDKKSQRSMWQKLGSIDYLGVVTLVSWRSLLGDVF